MLRMMREVRVQRTGQETPSTKGDFVALYGSQFSLPIRADLCPATAITTLKALNRKLLQDSEFFEKLVSFMSLVLFFTV